MFKPPILGMANMGFIRYNNAGDGAEDDALLYFSTLDLLASSHVVPHSGTKPIGSKRMHSADLVPKGSPLASSQVVPHTSTKPRGCTWHAAEGFPSS